MSARHRRAVKRCISKIEFLEQRTLFAVGVPTPDHVVIVIEENKAASSIIGSASAPYINSLAAGGANFTQSYAIEHPSQPNYLDFFSGSNQGITTDNLPAGIPYTTANLGANLLAKGLSFAGYSESLPSTDLTADSTVAGGYRRKHNPWVNWTNATPGTNQLPTTVNKDLSAFPTDFSLLPTVSFVIPTQYNDMHDDNPNDSLNAIQAGDAWLKAHLDAYAQWAKTHNSLLIVTFDEDDTAHNNLISTLFFGQQVKTGSYSETINHYSVLRTIEDMYGTTYAGASATASPITDAWATSANVAPTVTSLSDSPDPVAVNGNVTLTAIGAADSDGTVANVQFYRETNGVAGLQTATDLLIGTDTSSTGGYTATFSTTGLAVGTYTYYGIVTDNLGAVSPIVSTTNTVQAVNAVPTITSLSDSADPVSAGTSVTLTANGVADSDGTVASVKFYRETNGTSGLQTASDLLIGTDTSSTGGWTTLFSTTGLAATSYTYYAIVTDNLGAVSKTVSQSNTVAQNLVPTGSVWKYLDTGVSLDAVSWKTAGFVDTAWKSGPAQLGYGDGDEATVVGYGTNANAKYTTTYFRDSFSLTNTSTINTLTLRLLRDDGAVVYLNGTEVVRSNMPTGTITSSTFASTTVGSTDESKFFTFSVNPALLVNGKNEIAVEVHQSNLTSTDLSFDLQLLGVTNTPPTIKSLSDSPDPVTAGGNVTLTANTVADSGGTVASVKFYRETNSTAGLQTATDLLLGTDTSSTGGWTLTLNTTGLAAGTYTYYAQVTDNRGAVSTAVSTTNTVKAAAAIATALTTQATAQPSTDWRQTLWSRLPIAEDWLKRRAAVLSL